MATEETVLEGNSSSAKLVENATENEEPEPQREIIGLWVHYKMTLIIAIPLGIYVGSSFLFFPIFQDLVYTKVCRVAYGSVPGYCSNRQNTHKDAKLQTEANHILLLSSIALTIPSLFVSVLLGSLSDQRNRKLAAVIPFSLLVISDFTYIAQTTFMEISAYWLLASQFIFGIGGGYTGIFGTLFAYAADTKFPMAQRSTTMALLEGSMGLGGTIGYFLTGPLLNLIGYTGINITVLCIHCFCFFYVIIMLKEEEEVVETEEPKVSWRHKFFGYFSQAARVCVRAREGHRRGNILVLLSAFGVSYLVFSGSVDILFYYLKHQLDFSVTNYGYLKGCIYGLGTVMTLFLYPFLKSRGVSDVSLALVGLIARLFGRVILAAVFSTWFAFFLIGCDMFSRWGAASLRSLLSQQVERSEQGRMFGTIALLEGGCDLLASLIFNALYPATLSFFPQLSYVLLSALMILPVALLIRSRKHLTAPPDPRIG